MTICRTVSTSKVVQNFSHKGGKRESPAPHNSRKVRRIRTDEVVRKTHLNKEGKEFFLGILTRSVNGDEC